MLAYFLNHHQNPYISKMKTSRAYPLIACFVMTCCVMDCWATRCDCIIAIIRK